MNAEATVSFGPPGQPEASRLRSALLVVGAGYLFLTLCDSREGIAKDGDKVPWHDVAEVEISNGMVRVDRRDRLAGMTATAGEVPNAVAFSELARYVRQARTE